MAFKVNAITGNVTDETALPLNVGTSDPNLSVNGDMAAEYINSQGRLYFYVNGHEYYLLGTAS